MATVDSEKVVCGGIHAMTVAVRVSLEFYLKDLLKKENSSNLHR
jgi:hypothetical protein